MGYQTIRYEIEDRILTITLNRPDKLNAYTAQMGAELAEALERADADDDVRVVILTGEGRGFCAGADLSAGASSFDTKAGAGATNFGAGRTPRGGGLGFVGALFNCRKATIAAFNGPAVGVGVTLALPTDIKIASTAARFGFVFARRGLVPEAGSAWFLPKLVGLPKALQWCLSGRLIPAQEAMDGGLIAEVVEPDALLARSREMALEIAENTAPVSIALTRKMLWNAAGDHSPFEVMSIDGRLSMELGKGGDVREGVTAFLEKRAPNFPGKVSTDLPSLEPWLEA